MEFQSEKVGTLIIHFYLCTIFLLKACLHRCKTDIANKTVQQFHMIPVTWTQLKSQFRIRIFLWMGPYQMIRFKQSVRPMRIPFSPGKLKLAETENVPVAACREGFVKCSVRFTNTDGPFKASVQRVLSTHYIISVYRFFRWSESLENLRTWF